jgi:serine phosphatase RsbU (regulator of sigma subunit)
VALASLDDGLGRLGTMVLVQDVTIRVRDELALRARAREAMLAAAIGAAVTGPEPLRTKLGACTDAVVDHLNAAFARIWVLDPEEDVLLLEASSGLYTHLDGAHSRIQVGAFKIGRIAARQRPHLTNDVLDDDEISDPEWAQREQMVSFAGYPLCAGDHLLGVLALFGREPLPPATLDALAAVADTVAVGIQQARSEEEIQRLLTAEQAARLRAEEASRRHASLAQTLQQSLLPPRLPLVAGLDVSARYRWAGVGDEIGGDFYDLLRLDDDRWCAVLGDISGKGVGAARATALVRYTLRTAARSVPELPMLAGVLNEALLEDSLDRYCTLVLAAGQAGRPGSVSLLLAGHPYPLVVDGDGRWAEVGVPNLPVGMFADAIFEPSTVEVPTGSKLLLFSDGLVDVRRPNGTFDSTLLAETLPRLAGTDAEGLTAGLEAEAVRRQGGLPHDDIAILALAPL